MSLDELREAARLVRAHHEHFDGQGFPDGLADLAIPLGARILAVVSDYDDLQIGALTETRMDASQAKAFLLQSCGKRYDPNVVSAFIALLGMAEREPSSDMALGTAEIKPGMVLAQDFLTREGVLLLAVDEVLDDALIQQIRNFELIDGIQLRINIRRIRSDFHKS